MPRKYVVVGPPELARAKHREPPAMDHEPGWKESAFSVGMGELILDRILAGETVREITADPRMPSYATVYRWTHVVPEFGDAWRRTRARRAKIERLAEAQEAQARREAKRQAAVMDGRRPRDWVSAGRSTYTTAKAAAVCRAIRAGASLSRWWRSRACRGPTRSIAG